MRLAFLRIEDGKILRELTEIRRAETSHFQFNCDHGLKGAMIEKKVDEKFFAFDEQAFFAAHKAKVGTTERSNCLFDIDDKVFRENAFVNIFIVLGIDIIEVDEFKKIFVAKGTNGFRSESERRDCLFKVIGEDADVMIVVCSEVVEEFGSCAARWT